VAGIEALADGTRMIGVISHVPELAEQMPARIHVEKVQGGSSVELIRGQPTRRVVKMASTLS
jgi:exonuclease SbcC